MKVVFWSQRTRSLYTEQKLFGGEMLTKAGFNRVAVQVLQTLVLSAEMVGEVL